MGRSTLIGWCDDTVNATSGCEGCELWNGEDIRDCYAGNLHENRLAHAYPHLYDRDFQNVRLIPGRMMKAARWADMRGTKRLEKPWLNGLPRTIFVGDMGDFCSKAVPTRYIIDEIIGATQSREGQRHFWMLLTKHPRRLREISHMIGGLPDNCMPMTTVTSQTTARQRIPDLIETKCRWRGISAEPLFTKTSFYGLENLKTFYPWLDPYGPCGINFIIAGGQSGHKATPMHPEWARVIRDQCRLAGVPFFFKQWGTWAPISMPTANYKGERILMNVAGEIKREASWADCAASSGDWWGFEKRTKETSGRMLDGVEHNGFPAILESFAKAA